MLYTFGLAFFLALMLAARAPWWKILAGAALSCPSRAGASPSISSHRSASSSAPGFPRRRDCPAGARRRSRSATRSAPSSSPASSPSCCGPSSAGPSSRACCAPGRRRATPRQRMIRLAFATELRYDIAEQPADFVFNIHAARTPRQTVVSEHLDRSAAGARVADRPGHGNRYLRLRAGPGPLAVRYEATVDLDPWLESPDRIEEVPIARRAPEASPFIYPSRYCQSDRLRRLASREFGHLRTGYTPGAGDPRLGAQPHRIPPGELEQQHLGAGHARRAGGRVPRFRPPDDRAVPGAQHSGALRDQHRLRRGRRSSARRISTPSSRCSSASAGIRSIPPASRRRWASCASARAAMRPMCRSRRSSGRSRRGRRSFQSLRMTIRPAAIVFRTIASKRSRPASRALSHAFGASGSYPWSRCRSALRVSRNPGAAAAGPLIDPGASHVRRLLEAGPQAEPPARRAPEADYAAHGCPTSSWCRCRSARCCTNPAAQMRHVYFPTTAIVSLLYVMENGASAEIAVVGNEGSSASRCSWAARRRRAGRWCRARATATG